MKPSSTRIGIYAPNGDGHRFAYVQYLLRHMPDDHDVLLLTTPEALRSKNFALHLGTFENRFTTHLVEADEWDLLTSYSLELHTDLLVLPDGDSFAWRRAWRKGWKGSGNITALVMRSSGQHGGACRRAAGRLTKRLLFRLGNARHNIRLLRLESALWDPSQSNDGVPDPVTFHPDQGALEILLPLETFSRDIKWVGLVGALDPRKNVALVLDAALHTNRNGFGVILAGRMDQSIRMDVDAAMPRLRARGIPVLIVDRLLTDGQLDALLARLQCVVLAHSNEGPSGILGKCARAGTFIVAAGAQSLRADCRRLPASSRWSPLAVGDLARSIEAALDVAVVPRRDLRTVETFSHRLLQRAPEVAQTC